MQNPGNFPKKALNCSLLPHKQETHVWWSYGYEIRILAVQGSVLEVTAS